MMIIIQRIGKLTYLLVYSLRIDVVWYGPLMVAVLTFLRIYTCCNHGLEGNRFKNFS